jgi:hypothetical protein
MHLSRFNIKDPSSHRLVAVARRDQRRGVPCSAPGVRAGAAPGYGGGDRAGRRGGGRRRVRGAAGGGAGGGAVYDGAGVGAAVRGAGPGSGGGVRGAGRRAGRGRDPPARRRRPVRGGRDRRGVRRGVLPRTIFGSRRFFVASAEARRIAGSLRHLGGGSSWAAGRIFGWRRIFVGCGEHLRLAEHLRAVRGELPSSWRGIFA